MYIKFNYDFNCCKNIILKSYETQRVKLTQISQMFYTYTMYVQYYTLQQVIRYTKSYVTPSHEITY